MTQGRPGRPLRVLELFEAADGGVPEHVRRLSAGLEERGQHVTVSGPSGAPLRPVFEATSGGFVPISMVGSMVAPREDARALATAARLIRRSRFDIVHVHGLKPALIGRAVAIARRVPVVYTPHCFIYRNIHLRARHGARARAAALLGAERLLGRGTAAVVAVASEERDAAVRDGVVPARRAHVVLNGVAPDTDAPADPRLLEFRGEGPLLGLVAGLRDQKGLPTLLDALELLAARGAAPRFAIVGNGPMEAEVRERIASGPLAATTIVLGFEQRPEPYLAALDAFVLPSYWEGLPIAILEAMAMGLPVIATAVGGTPEAVADGRTGYLVPARDPEALAARMGELARAPDLAARMGEAGREEVRLRFGVERMVDELLTLYRAVADESLGAGR